MPLFLLIFFLLLVAYSFLISYYHQAWNRMPVYDPQEPTGSTFISVIIPMRNEETNILALLGSLSRQRYPRSLFELVLIDDHSTDNTWPLLQQASSTGMAVQAISLKEHAGDQTNTASYKKMAIDAGIGSSKGTLIVTTDADCEFQEDWLTTIASFYESTGAKFIAAPVRIRSRSSLLSVFQTLDFLTLQGITGASVFRHIHSMCNGANLAYEKQAFIEVKGFDKIDHLPSGDDMFLMHKIYKRYPDKVFYLKNRSAIVDTAPVESWKAFFHQRVRWASKADSYDDKRIFWALLLVYLVNVGFLIMAITACWKALWAFFFIILLLAKVLIEFPFVNAVAIFFDQQRLMKYFPFLQPVHILYTIIAGWFGKFGYYEWKGRRVRK